MCPETEPGTVLCVGLATLDVVHRIDAPPEPNRKVTATRQDVAAGGPATNAAVVAAALGAPVGLLTALGPSPIAAAARSDLESWGVHVLDVAPEHDLAVSAITVDANTGDRAVSSPDAAGADPAWPGDDHAGSPAVVLIDGHYPRLAVAAARHGRSCGALVVLDAGRWRPVFADLLPLADVVAASADFTLPDGRRGPHALVQAGARAAVVTDGAGPVRFSSAEGTSQVPVPVVPVRDTLGAGDAFHGALAASLAATGAVPTGPGLADALADAVTVAAHRVQHTGPRSFLAGLPRVGIR